MNYTSPLNVILGVIAFAVVAIVAVVLMVKKYSGSKVEETVSADANRYESLEAKAVVEAEKMTGAERADIIRRHSTGSWTCNFQDGVLARMSGLSIASVEVYGVTFTSVKRAINKSAMTDRTALLLLTLEKEMVAVRKMKFAATSYYTTVSSPTIGEVFIYKASKIAIETNSGSAPRMIIKLNKDAKGMVDVTDIYVSDSDIRNAKSYDHYDMTKGDIQKRFEKLIMNNDEYAAEIEVLEEILGRLGKYNYLTENNLLKVEGGRYIFSIPTDAQLADLEQWNDEEADDEDDEEEVTEDLFEDVHSSAE